MFRRVLFQPSRRLSSSAQQQPLSFWLNGVKKEVAPLSSDKFLIDYLREEGLTGAKLTCGEGGCGACTVAVASYDATARRVRFRPLNSCLVNMNTLHNTSITTVEHVGTSTQMHLIQREMTAAFASQCGYCSPGFVMALWSRLADAEQSGEIVSETSLLKALDGNLCRCTGYRSIAAAVQAVAAKAAAAAAAARASDDATAAAAAAAVATAASPASSSSSFSYVNEEKNESFHSPSNLLDLTKLMASNDVSPRRRLVVGNTELGIVQRFRHESMQHLVSPHLVPELNAFKVDEAGGVRIGAALDLEHLRRLLAPYDASNAFARCLLQQLYWFSGTSIRSGACVGGNIATASPISDLAPVWLAADAVVRLAAFDAVAAAPRLRSVPAAEFFLPRYRQTAMEPNEVIVDVYVPPPPPPSSSSVLHAAAFKQSQRREDDIATVTACIVMQVNRKDNSIEKVRLAFGGVAPYTLRAKAAEAAAARVGTVNNVEQLLHSVNSELLSELSLPSNVPGGRAEYRSLLAAGFWTKFVEAVAATGSAADASSPSTRAHHLLRGLQTHGTAQKSPHHPTPVGESIAHTSSALQVCGEAEYTTDLGRREGEVAAALVASKRAHARIVSVDASEALKLPGVLAIFTHKDVPNSNVIGDIVQDEEVFASEHVVNVGQPVALIAATDAAVAWRAASLVHVEYEDLPATLTIEAADAANDHIPYADGLVEHEIVRADTTEAVDGDASQEAKAAAVARAIDSSDLVVEGRVRLGGQEHFYFEPMATLVVPEDGGRGQELTIYSSTQNLNKTQEHVAHVLGMPMNRVVAKVRRIGGGFGGKETQSVNLAAAVAVAAHHLRRPVRMVLPRDVDMQTTGKRHAFVATYRAGFDKTGRVRAMDVRLVNNAGSSYDLSGPVLDRAILHAVNAYNVPFFRVRGRMVRTNKPSNTAFRGFGGPQGMLVAETAMEHAATRLGMSVDVVRRLNLARSSDRTHYGQRFKVNLPKLWREALALGQLKSARREAAAFNRVNRRRKRGVAAIPSCFGLAFTFTTLNQGSALVHIYVDGTVVVTIGGVEMGQGLFTKVAQTVAGELAIPLNAVHVKDTSTEKIANASATAASMGSDLYCMAAKNACEELCRRLAPFSGATLRERAQAAWFARTSLSAHAFYAPKVSGYDFRTGKGEPFSYYTSGAAVTVAEIDTLTGDYRLLRTDLVMDVGRSINPSIDIGQIEGAFVQGMGWLMMEDLVFGGEPEHVWLESGRLLTPGPGTYKIPALDDVPREFNIHLARDTDNDVSYKVAPCLLTPSQRAVYRSRGIGEPPLMLGASAMFAVRNAIAEARKEAGVDPWTPVDAPLTAERVRMSIVDDLQRDATAYERVITSY